jgi:peroxiredoxin
MNKKAILLAVIVLCLSALVYISLSGAPPSAPPPLPVNPPGESDLPPGHPPLGDDGSVMAPDFTLDSLNAGQVSLSKFRGKVVVINFWSSGCPPCVMEIPSLMKLKASMAGKPFEILTITSDPRKLSEEATRELNLTLPVLLDPNGKTAMAYGAYGLPSTFIIAADGTVDNRVMGAANWADGSVVDYMNKLINSSAPKTEPEPTKAPGG